MLKVDSETTDKERDEQVWAPHQPLREKCVNRLWYVLLLLNSDPDFSFFSFFQGKTDEQYSQEVLTTAVFCNV